MTHREFVTAATTRALACMAAAIAVGIASQAAAQQQPAPKAPAAQKGPAPSAQKGQQKGPPAGGAQPPPQPQQQAQGEQPYRADQIRKWIFGKRVADFDSMTDLSAGLRKKLAESFAIFSSRVSRHQISQDGTEKLLLELSDGENVECVLMREDDRRTVCVSTQVGCGMGCVFCASGLLGLARNLSAGEIIEQILHVDRLLPPLERIIACGQSPAEEMLAKFNGAWHGSVEPAYSEYAF